MMQRIIGQVFSGFMVKLYGAAIALYIGVQAYAYIVHVFGADSALSKALG
jgi:hypothetical protein